MVDYKDILARKVHEQLIDILGKVWHNSPHYHHACILINSDKGLSGDKLYHEKIAQVLHINSTTVERVKRWFVEEVFDVCMNHKPYSQKGPIIADGDFEAHLIAQSCSEALEGYALWLLRLLVQKEG